MKDISKLFDGQVWVAALKHKMAVLYESQTSSGYWFLTVIDVKKGYVDGMKKPAKPMLDFWKRGFELAGLKNAKWSNVFK